MYAEDFTYGMRGVGRLRERQYQLAAQKHNEAYLKHNYFERTARYFERESGNAKHYDSWNFRTLDPRGQLEKARKAKKLSVRRNKLRSLLQGEEEAYKRELDELKPKKHREEVPSLEVLKKKLREKRAEESLYLPQTCRRLQSYFVCPGGITSPQCSTLKDTNLQYSRVCNDSTNFVKREGESLPRRTYRMSRDQTKSSKEHENHQTHQEISRSSSAHDIEISRQCNPKYSQRYSRRSLEHTNVRSVDLEEDYTPSRRLNASSPALSSFNGRRVLSHTENTMDNLDKENYRSASKPSNFEGNPNYVEHHLNDSNVHGGRYTSQKSFEDIRPGEMLFTQNYEKHPDSNIHCGKDSTQKIFEDIRPGEMLFTQQGEKHSDSNIHSGRDSSQKNYEDVRPGETLFTKDYEKHHDSRTQRKSTPENLNYLDTDQLDASSSKEAEEAEEAEEAKEAEVAEEAEVEKQLDVQDSREFESEKSLPWMRMDPHDKNLSKHMFLYLHHKELKNNIDNLTKRELHACTKHSWDDALRLRDMRNRLELIREKRLYHTENLHLDEDMKKLGLESIHKREEELAGREHACTNSNMYSEEAKALWEKWVHEDEESAIKDARVQRETLMSRLEKDWQSLAVRDKDKITQSFKDVLDDPTLQEEHKLVAELSAAKMKSMLSPTE